MDLKARQESRRRGQQLRRQREERQRQQERQRRVLWLVDVMRAAGRVSEGEAGDGEARA